MNKKANFVITSDEETKELLLKEGFTLINSNNGKYTFLNCKEFTLNFSDKKCVFTDKLCI